MQMIENDYAFLRASVPQLENYLLSDVLYYPVTAEGGRQLSGDTTRLTLGNLLLSVRRLEADGLPVEIRNEAETALSQVNQIRNKWLSNWKRKAGVEIPNRLRLWKNYLEDWRENSPSAAGEYRYNVRLRVILELLFSESDALFVQEQALLRALDTRLKAKGTPGQFIWDPSYQSAFPSDHFWFLYLKV